MFEMIFWHSVGYGNWELDGETANNITTEGDATTVQCLSTHLTSFTVLVDVAGGLQVCQYVTAVIMIAYITIIVVTDVLTGHACRGTQGLTNYIIHWMCHFFCLSYHLYCVLSTARVRDWNKAQCIHTVWK